jgi:hypothetical protein
MPIEPITFGKGLNTGNSPLMLKDGELVSCSGFGFTTQGEMAARDPLTAVNAAAVGSINGIHRYINWLLLTDAGAVRYKWDLAGYCDRYTPASDDFTLLTRIGVGRPRFADMDDFTFIANGQDRKAFSGALYDWAIENPTLPPAGTDGAGGNPSGTYSLYYSFLILFPNGRTYETDTSPAGTVSVTSKAISWSGIGVCPYTGTGVKVHRKLYRYSTGLGETYYVATIPDNTTTTYTDDFSDATLQANDILDTTAYAPPPEGLVDVANYLQRIFGIKGSSLYYSEPYLPFAFKGTSTIAITRPGEDLKNCIPWGDQIYLGWPASWKRLQGADADTWAVKSTFSEQGPINTHTTQVTRFGILFQWYDGIYVFDGTVSRNITAKDLGLALFTDIANPKLAHAEFDGQRYWFVYPSTGTTLDKCLIIDFRTYPDIRFYNLDFIPSAYEYHFQTGIKYFGKADGYQYEESGTEVIATSLQTGDKAMGSVLQQKNISKLYYDIDTGSEDVVVTLYADGTAQTPAYTLNTASRMRDFIKTANHQGYRFSLRLACSDSSNVVIYEPWGIEYTPFGGG